MAKLNYGGTDFTLSSDTDIDELKNQITRALLHGGDHAWVSITSANSQPYDLLVHPGVSIWVNDSRRPPRQTRSAVIV